jgi:acyl-CoA synthetase (AMP-forming)/AMP-acid ligase II
MASTEGGWFLTRDVRENLDAASSPGTAALNVETRVVTIEEGEPGNPDGLCDLNETGELIVNSPHYMDRYLNQPKGTAESFRDGWYYTGDLGYVDTGVVLAGGTQDEHNHFGEHQRLRRQRRTCAY